MYPDSPMWNATEHTRLVDARPERVEVRVGRRPAERGTGPERDDARPARQHAVELGDGAVEVDAATAAAPRRCGRRWSKPQSSSSHSVERVEVRVELIGVVLHEVLDAHGERGEQQDRLDALAVHQREARARAPRTRAGSVRRRVGLPVRAGAHRAQHLAQRAGLGDAVAERVGEERERPVADHHDARRPPSPVSTWIARSRELRLDVAGEAVARLVVVVVGVDEEVVDLHGPPFAAWSRPIFA